jgi:hypothetical protein
MESIRYIKDRDLSSEQLRSKRIKQREYEIDAQIVNALEKGNPVSLLLTHPAGLMGRGSPARLFATDEEEIAFIIARYNELGSKRTQGKMLDHVDADLKERLGKPTGTQARVFKDHAERKLEQWNVEHGLARHLTIDELRVEQIEAEDDAVNAMNAVRAKLGMKKISKKEA